MQRDKYSKIAKNKQKRGVWPRKQKVLSVFKRIAENLCLQLGVRIAPLPNQCQEKSILTSSFSTSNQRTNLSAYYWRVYQSRKKCCSGQQVYLDIWAEKMGNRAQVSGNQVVHWTNQPHHYDSKWKKLNKDIDPWW